MELLLFTEIEAGAGFNGREFRLCLNRCARSLAFVLEDGAADFAMRTCAHFLISRYIYRLFRNALNTTTILGNQLVNTVHVTTYYQI